MITTEFGTLWKRAVGDSSLKLNPTLVRKHSTSTVRGNMPEIKQVTANLLCHSLRIAEKNYALFDRVNILKILLLTKSLRRRYWIVSGTLFRASENVFKKSPEKKSQT